MTSHPPTPEQQAILSAVKFSKDSMMIDAYAGTGKTSTLVMIADALPTQPAIALAFNTSIKKELEKRFPPFFKVMTLNGLGHLAWMRALPREKKIILDERKLGRLVTQVFKDFQYQGNEDAWSNVRTLVSKAMQAGIVPASRPHKGFRPDTPEQWAMLADEHWLLDMGEMEIGLAREILTRSVAEGFEGTISFDDQIYLPVCFNGQFPRYGLLLGDEVQDWSVMNRVLAQRTCSGRLILVGDPRQCFPPGTKIRMPRGVIKNIEDVQEGQLIVSYATRKSVFKGLTTQGRKILKKIEYDFDGELISITTSSARPKPMTLAELGLGDVADEPLVKEEPLKQFNHSCTPNHRCLVRMKRQEGYFIYMMRKNNQFRIGTARTVYQQNNGGMTAFGPGMRARQEDADALWILSFVAYKEQALIEEKVICAEFGLPDLVFNNNGMAATPQVFLDSAWNRIGDNKARAYRCLRHFKREIDFPLWKKGSNDHIGMYSFVTEACNVLPTLMEVKPYLGRDKCSTWVEIEDISYVPYKGKVYGLEVESTEDGRRLYIANDIVTHNSIYQFRGADSDSMTRLRALRQAWIDLPLSVTFRCPKVIVDRQQSHAPGFTAFHSNKIGEVKRFQRFPQGTQEPIPSDPEERSKWKQRNHASNYSEIGPQTWSWPQVEKLSASGTLAILCRNNAPLLKIAFRLLRQNVPVTMLGRDIGKTLVALSRKVLPDDDMRADVCVLEVNQWRESQIALANANRQEEKVANLHDQAECLLAVIEGARAETASAIRWYLKELFERTSGHVVISTIHRAKGLEYDCVLHLDPWRIPSKYAMQNPVQLQQEKNLLYVCETRTKRLLIEANLEDFE